MLPAGALAWVAGTLAKASVAKVAAQALTFGLVYGASVNVGYNVAHSYTQVPRYAPRRSGFRSSYYRR